MTLADMHDLEKKSLGELIDGVTERSPDKIALIENERICTYASLSDQSSSLARGLSAIGVKKGDRVAVLMPNTIETMVVYLGIIKLGALLVGINVRYRDKEIKFMLGDSGASTIITIRDHDGYDFVSTLEKLRSNLPGLKNIVVAGSAERSDLLTLDELKTRGGAGKYTYDSSIDPCKDLLELSYTSGTTGVPKGTMITHYQAARNSLHGIELLDISPDDVVLAQLPWYHTFAFTVCLNASFLSGATMVIQDPYNPLATLNVIEKHGVTVHNGTPAMFLMEMNHKDFKKFDISSLRVGVAAGASFSAHLLDRINQEMGFMMTSMWGMTETSGIGSHCSLSDTIEMKTETVGLPISDCEVKICDVSGKEVPVGSDGELWFRGWTATRGYWNNDAETRNQITEDGWLKTGDVARILENNYIQIIGRIKELTNRGGYKVYPAEVEELLIKHPKIAEVAIVGIPNEILGELICACVILLDHNDPLSIAELREFCKDKIADYKLPDELSIMETFPRLASGKIKKLGEGGLKEMARADNKRQNIQTLRKEKT